MHLQWVLSVGDGNGYGTGHNASVGAGGDSYRSRRAFTSASRRAGDGDPRSEVSRGQGG